MSKKRKQNNKPEAPSRKNKGSSSQLLKPVWLYAVVAGSLVIVCAAILNLALTRDSNQQLLQTASDQIARAQAAALAQFIRDQEAYLQHVASRSEVRAALADNNSVALRSLETESRQGYPFVQSLNLVPLDAMGTAAPDFPAETLNSIETDMISKAVRGKPSPAEAYKGSGKGKGKGTISLLKTVAGSNGEVEGALLLKLDSNSVKKVIAGLAAGQGQITLLQQVNNRKIPVFEQGDASDAAPLASASFPGNSGWQLDFQASDELVGSLVASTTMAWLLLGVTAALLLVSGLLLYRRLHSQLETQFAYLKDYLSQLEGGERALPPALQLQHLTDIGAIAFEISQQPAISGKPSNSDAAATAELSEKMSGKSASAPAREEDSYVEESTTTEPAPAPEPEPVSPTLFRAYDIRGIVGDDLTPQAVYQIGLAVGSEAQDQGQQAVIVARDGRLSSEDLANQLVKGLQDSGTDVIDLGLAPTPVLYFATQQLNTASGVMITGSHNPPEYNGLKVVIGGKTLHDDSIKLLQQRIELNQLHQGSGTYSTADLSAQYIDYVLGDIAVAQPLKIVIDCGNGVAGGIAPRLFEDLGCEVVPLYCEIDGHFPNHHPDPTIAANLTDLIEQVREQGADLGIAFDGDGDRLGVVSASGEIIAADRLLMLFAQDVVSRNPGCDVIFDVKCTRHLNDVIASYGGRPIMWKSGHSMIKQKMTETGALLGGEFSGHIFFKERWFGFDDGLYSAARLIEIMSTSNPNLDQLLEQFPKPCGTPEIKVAVAEEQKFALAERFAQEAHFGEAKISQIDGIRAEFPEGWGLLRASNTTPDLILRFEAESESALETIRATFLAELQKLEPGLDF